MALEDLYVKKVMDTNGWLVTRGSQDFVNMGQEEMKLSRNKSLAGFDRFLHFPMYLFMLPVMTK